MTDSPRENEDDARALIASARALLEEFVEEGLDSFERVAFEPVPAARAGSPDAAAATPPVPAPQPAAASDQRGAARSGLGPDAQPEPAPISSPARESLAAAQWGSEPSLDDVRSALGECTRCPLCEGRKSIVFGDGNPDADLMFIGEGPGENEDLQGLPFVGRAGELLTQMIEGGLEIARSDVYICNIVKCRPPGNRNPLPQEVAACRPFLDGQIDAIRPKVIVSLGKPAAGLLLGREVAITRIRGTWQTYRGIPLMPTLHPAFVLRQYTPENRRNVWEDLKAALAKSREG